MEITKERMGQIALLVLKYVLKRCQTEYGVFNNIEAERFVNEINTFNDEIPEGADVKTEELFALFSEILPEESRVAFDKAVKDFLGENPPDPYDGIGPT